MSHNSELPSAAEKLSSKFILDALQAKHAKKLEGEIPIDDATNEAHSEVPAMDFRETQLEFDSCGTVATHDLTQIDEVPQIQTEEGATEEVQAEEATTDEAPKALSLPAGKKYFRIGEVASLLKVEPHVLRYWESEFKRVKPSKTGSGQRVYSRKDVETLHYIRHLLHEEKFSIRGAKKKLNEQRRIATAAPVTKIDWTQRNSRLKSAAADLKELIRILRHDLV